MTKGTNSEDDDKSGKGWGEIMRVSLLTECVKILDGHTINKRYPSDDIGLRSAGSSRRVARKIMRQTTLEPYENPAGNRSTRPSVMAVYVTGSKSCICHDAMGGVARDWRVPETT